MISETMTKKGTPAITSDRWHVVHARFAGDEKSARPFVRAIVSEHDDRKTCHQAALALTTSLAAASKRIPVKRQDQVFSRPPHYKSLKMGRWRQPDQPARG